MFFLITFILLHVLFFLYIFKGESTKTDNNKPKVTYKTLNTGVIVKHTRMPNGVIKIG